MTIFKKPVDISKVDNLDSTFSFKTIVNLVSANGWQFIVKEFKSCSSGYRYVISVFNPFFDFNCDLGENHEDYIKLKEIISFSKVNERTMEGYFNDESHIKIATAIAYRHLLDYLTENNLFFEFFETHKNIAFEEGRLRGINKFRSDLSAELNRTD